MNLAQILDSLTPERRLALAYAPQRVKGAALVLLGVDAALARLVRETREPMLAQLKLAWWREQLGRPAAERAGGEPLLELAAQHWPRGCNGLVPLIDGWENLVGEAPLDPPAFARLAAARGDACGALAREVGDAACQDEARRAGTNWGLAELAGRISHPVEREHVAALCQERDWSAPRFPASLRFLAVLHGLAARSQGRRELLNGYSDLFAAMRIGMLGI